MKVLLVNGSPHEHGCTAEALEIIKESLAEKGVGADIFWLGTEPIRGCTGCAFCKKAGKCVFDDIVNQFTALAEEYDGFVFGSPVHYASADGAITSFLDRVFYSSGKKFAQKPGAAIVCARRAGTTAALDQLNKYFMISQMPVASSRYWNMVHGNTPAQVREDEEGVEIMRTLAHNMAWLLKCIAAADAAGVERPGPIAKVYTNFIR